MAEHSFRWVTFVSSAWATGQSAYSSGMIHLGMSPSHLMPHCMRAIAMAGASVMRRSPQTSVFSLLSA